MQGLVHLSPPRQHLGMVHGKQRASQGGTCFHSSPGKQPNPSTCPFPGLGPSGTAGWWPWDTSFALIRLAQGCEPGQDRQGGGRRGRRAALLLSWAPGVPAAGARPRAIAAQRSPVQFVTEGNGQEVEGEGREGSILGWGCACVSDRSSVCVSVCLSLSVCLSVCVCSVLSSLAFALAKALVQ